MLGRRAIADPLLFERLRGRAADLPAATVLRRFLEGLLARYPDLFDGDAQVLARLKEPLAFAPPELAGPLRRAKSLDAFAARVAALA
jgi:hypothetical protein